MLTTALLQELVRSPIQLRSLPLQTVLSRNAKSFMFHISESTLGLKICVGNAVRLLLPHKQSNPRDILTPIRT